MLVYRQRKGQRVMHASAFILSSIDNINFLHCSMHIVSSNR